MVWIPPSPEDIKALRGERTQAEMAEVAGLGAQPRWAEYESGERVPTQERWELILLRIGRHPAWKLVRRAPRRA